MNLAFPSSSSSNKVLKQTFMNSQRKGKMILINHHTDNKDPKEVGILALITFENHSHIPTHVLLRRILLYLQRRAGQ
jgi:predicted N-formylglutamate amidohydrolase